MMELTALLGMALSALAVTGCHNILVFAGLWLLYLSLSTAGQTFLHFQWDIFVLETGFISALYASPGISAREPHEPVTLALRWLAFKFMLSSGEAFAACSGVPYKLWCVGVVKLTARDSTWNNLTAMVCLKPCNSSYHPSADTSARNSGCVVCRSTISLPLACRPMKPGSFIICHRYSWTIYSHRISLSDLWLLSGCSG